MDETRAQAYLQLIQTLLNCPNGDESQILQDNLELLDGGFLQACEVIAENLRQQGQENPASFLRNLASQLGEFFDTNDEGDSDDSEGEDSQEYVNFILQLLQAEQDSNSDVAVAYPILAQRQHLLNLRFAETLQQVAQNLIAGENTETIAFIVGIIENLSIDISNFPLGSRANNLEIAITGYQIVLNNREPGSEKFAQTQNNLAIAYRNRIKGEKAENIEVAIAYYTAALTVRTPDAFPQDWAMTQNNLAAAYSDRIKGEKAENIEVAIAYYTAALTVYKPDAFPQDWAMTQNNLAAAYSDRIKGEKAENIEVAIAFYTAALTVRTPDAFPQDWAMTQNNLAIAYRNRIKGEKAKNIEVAIAYYTAALTVYKPDAFPQDWAMTQNNLAIAYRNRIKGEKAKNIEVAIAYYTAALTVYKPDAFPQDWAMTQNNLAIAYSDRIKGEKAENIEVAIAFYTAALTVYKPDAFPQDWAMTQNNLAIAYRNRIKGEKAKNIEVAIAYYTAALTVYKPDAFPQDWAMTQNNLANAYSDRIKGEKAENIEVAIAFYTAALTVYKPDAFPQDWAMTQNNLAIAYSDRIKGEKAENIEVAIAYYTAALTVYKPDAFPQQWAMTQNNLANAYSNRIKGEKAENIEVATKCYRQALEIRTPSAFPLECLNTGRNLGNFAFELQDWENAIYGYENAITAAEQSREWATSQRSKRQILEKALPMYEKMVLACIHLQRYETALLTVERSKSRTLIELLDNANLYPKNSTPAQQQQLSQLRRQIASLQQQLDIEETETETETTTETNTDTLKEKSNISTAKSPQTSDSHLEAELKTLQQQVTQLLREINDPDFNLTQQVIPQLPDFTQFLDSQTALIEWYLPPNPDSGFHVFIVTNPIGDPPKSPLRRGTLSEEDPPLVSRELPVPPLGKGGLGGVPLHIHHIPFTPEQHQQLNTDIATYLSDYGKPTWGEALSQRLDTLAASLHLNQILADVSPTIEKLILIPHRDLHLLPLHALPATRKLCNGETKSGYLLDLYTNGIQYSPSSQFLERLHQRKRPPLNEILPLFAIQNPTEDLNYTEIEVEEISRRFNPHAHILKRREATKVAFNSAATLEKLTASHYAHFSCHGSFNWENPLNSGLVFAGILEPPQPPLVRGEQDVEAESDTKILSEAPQTLSDPPQPPLIRGEQEVEAEPSQPALEQEVEAEVRSYVTLRDGRRFPTDIQCLTLKEIFASLDLPLCRLVSLSACETGLVKRLITDEYIGLASGFLYAGASNVVSSLWRVSDFSTAFLMIRFYQNLKNPDLSVGQALQGAQFWLRTITRKDFLAWLTNEVKMAEDGVDDINILLQRNFPSQPFADPRYWAAFCAIGI